MILLEPGNRILAETLAAKINFDTSTGEKREHIDVRLSDFDDASYRVFVDPNARNILQLSMYLPCYGEIKGIGSEDALKTFYGGYVIDPVGGADVTLQINLDEIKEDKQALIDKLSLLKQNTIGGPFYRYFNALAEGKPLNEPAKFSLRKDTIVYFVPKDDRVTVIFSLNFLDSTDLAIGKVVMQEFVETRRHNKDLGRAPPVAFSYPPPLELKAFNITEPVGNLGFISFVVMKDHVNKDRRDKIVRLIQMFRTYVQYHIKCSKAFFHQRMRGRVADLLKVLNRAKTIQDTDKEKKTASGKTFKRADDEKDLE